ncbi:MAG TPA: tRNA dimethylallyltransferase, partial [Acidimicrobiales bacterium]
TLGSGRPFSSFGPGLERYPSSPVTMVGMRRDAAESDRWIEERFTRLMDEGFLDEVRGLASRPGGLSRTARQALGYRELLTHLEDGVPLEDAVAEAIRRTRAFAKRQRAWFRRDPRIEWIDPGDDPVTVVLGHVDRDAGGPPR